MEQISRLKPPLYFSNKYSFPLTMALEFCTTDFEADYVELLLNITSEFIFLPNQWDILRMVFLKYHQIIFLV